MVHNIRARLGSDDGIGLIEIMIAIMILGVILSALAATITSSLAAMHKDELRVRATHVANQELEFLRAQEWDSVGFFSGDTGYVPTWTDDGVVKDTVTLGATRPASSSAPLPQETVDVDGIDYAVTRQIVWVDDAADGLGAADPDPQDYKQFQVEVAWSERGVARSIESMSTRAPTIEEVPLAAASAPPVAMTITAYDIQPNPVTIHTSGNTAADIVITATTSAAANTAIVSVPLTAATTLTYPMSPVTGSVPATEWTMTIPAGTNSFSSGLYDFSIEVQGSAGTDTAGPITMTFAEASSVIVVEVSNIALSRPLCVSNGNPKALHFATDVTFDVSGLGSGDLGRIGWPSLADGSPASVIATTGSSATLSATIPVGTPLSGNRITINAEGTRVVDATPAVGSAQFDVTRTNDAGGCPTS